MVRPAHWGIDTLRRTILCTRSGHHCPGRSLRRNSHKATSLHLERRWRRCTAQEPLRLRRSRNLLGITRTARRPRGWWKSSSCRHHRAEQPSRHVCSSFREHTTCTPSRPLLRDTCPRRNLYTPTGRPHLHKCRPHRANEPLSRWCMPSPLDTHRSCLPR